MPMYMARGMLACLGFSVTGVLLTNPATLKPWVEAGTTMADEFAALLLDRPEYSIPDVYRIKAATFPVLDSGKNTFLVKGFILQMGQEDVVPLVKNIETTVPTVVNMRCTVDAVDFEAADWAAAQSSPVKFTLNRLKMPEASRVMAVWGRSFRSDGKPCSPKEATSIRFHMAVGENFASDILRQSFSKVSVTAVKDDYRADRQYYVIWLKVNRPEVEAILQTVPTHYGYVRGRSGFGVRCLLAKAKEVWQKCRPGEDFKEPVKAEFVYRLHGVPSHVDASVLEILAKEQGWAMRPLRRHRVGSWTLAAETKWPHATIMLNGDAMLLEEVQHRAHLRPQVIGGRPVRRQSDVSDKTLHGTSADPWEAGNDPWTAYRSTEPHLHELSHILFWGSTFTARLLAWARLLQFYINFCICTQSVLPVNEGTKYQPRYVLPDQKPEIALVPQPAALVLRNWATALAYLAKLVQQPVLQGNNISKTFTLCSLLRKRGVDLAGISVRPVMPQADLTAEVLGSKTPHVSVQGLWALPHIPKVPALIDIPLIQGTHLMCAPP